LTPTELNRLGTQLKSINGELPGTVNDWNTAIDALQEAKQEAKVELEANLKKELTEASVKLSKVIFDLDKQSVELQAEKRLNNSLETQIAELRKQCRESAENITLLTKNVATQSEDLKRIAGERNKTKDSLIIATEKVREQNQGLKAEKLKNRTLKDRLTSLRGRSLIKRILNQY
jgi:chromosome segregation ATPase